VWIKKSDDYYLVCSTVFLKLQTILRLEQMVFYSAK